MISTLLSLLVGIIVLFPFIIMIMLLVIYRRMGKSPETVIGHVADITTPFLFFSIYIVSRTIFGEGVGSYIAIVTILITIFCAVIEWKRVKDFQIMRLLKKVWRFLFLVLAAAYIVLLVVGVILKILEYVK